MGVDTRLRVQAETPAWLGVPGTAKENPHRRSVRQWGMSFVLRFGCSTAPAGADSAKLQGLLFTHFIPKPVIFEGVEGATE